MTFLISYDISKDKTRSKVADVLERCGCLRLQKSVFLAAHYSPKNLALLKLYLENIWQKNPLQSTDSLIVVPIDKDDLKHIFWAGNAQRFQDILATAAIIIL